MAESSPLHHDDYKQCMNDDYFLDSSLVEALDKAVTQSVNRALAVALEPFARQLRKYTMHMPLTVPSNETDEPSSDTTMGSKARQKSTEFDHATAVHSISKNPIPVHAYSPLPSTSGQHSPAPLVDYDSNKASTHSSQSDVSQVSSYPKSWKHRSSGPASTLPSKTSTDSVNPLGFDPDNIVHPAWVPISLVAEYAHAKLRKSYDRDVRNYLCAECPRPDLPDRVAETPELDPDLVTFLKCASNDPKKRIDRSWKSCQDKVLDLTGPLCKILELAVQAKESGSVIDPNILAGWAQRALCQLGNANCALSVERRRSILITIDPKLAELATAEAGPIANGLLFGNKFVKDLVKFVHTFTPTEKAQTSLQKAVHPYLFAWASRFRGHLPGEAMLQGPARGFQTRRHGWLHSSQDTFFPTRSQGRYGRGGFRTPGTSTGSNQKQD